MGITGKVKSISGEYRAEDNRLGLKIEKIKNLRLENLFDNNWNYADAWASEVNNKGVLKGFKEMGNIMYIDDLHDNLDKWLNPRFIGGSDDDLMRAKYYVGTSNLRVDGKNGDDTISGGRQGDTLIGGGGNDSISGESGDDLLRGGKGSDILEGGLSNDTIDGRKGNDLIAGGQGSDVFQISAGIDRVSDFDLRNDKIALGSKRKFTFFDDPEGVLVGENPQKGLLLIGVDYDEALAFGIDLFVQPI